MINMANINPSQKDYKNLSKFKFFTLTNFPFIEADFDAITNYELMCKIVEYLNNVIENEQNVSYNVQQLYNAFMELQNAINAEIAEQNARIEQYFDDINIQTFVDNKINEMIESNEFQELLIDAIKELNPNALKDEKRINTLNFGGTLVREYDMENINNSIFLSTTMKPVVIDILNDMIKNNERYYYFVNGDEDENTMKLFKLDIGNLDNGSIYLYVYYWINYFSLNNPTVVWEQDYIIALSDGVITDISIDYGNKVTRMLYTGGGGGGASYPVYYLNSNSGFETNNINGNLSSDDVSSLMNFANDALENGFHGFILYVSKSSIFTGVISLIYSVSISNASWNLLNFKCIGCSDNAQKLDSVGSFANTFYISGSLADGVVVALNNYVDGGAGNNYILYTNNTTQFVPQNQYEPATKDYVDSSRMYFVYGNFPYTAGSDFDILQTSYFTGFRLGGGALLPLYYDVQIFADVKSGSSLTGDVILATTPHNYAGFSTEQPSVATQAWTGIAQVYNNANDAIFIACDARYSPNNSVWEIHMRIPTGTTLTGGASVNLHLNYMRANIPQ